MPVEGDHSHCKVCGRVCAAGEATCSKACRQKREAQLASRRRYSYLLYAAIAILLIVLLSSFAR